MSDEAIAEIAARGFTVLRGRFAPSRVEACRRAFWPRLLAYLERRPEPNRGPNRHFLPLPFEPPIFDPVFFFDEIVLRVVRGAMDDRVVADQWGCDVPLLGSDRQAVHADFQRPLFAEAPDLPLPPFAIVVSFGLVRIVRENGPIEIAPGTHRLPRAEALRAVESGEIALEPVPLEIGDVLVRHPWALHRGTPNTTDDPRPLASIRWVRRWYADASREVGAIPLATWEALTVERRSLLRFERAEGLA